MKLIEKSLIEKLFPVEYFKTEVKSADRSQTHIYELWFHSKHYTKMTQRGHTYTYGLIEISH